MSKTKSALEIAEELAQARLDKSNERARQAAAALAQFTLEEREKWGPVLELLEEAAAKYPERVELTPPHANAWRFRFRLGSRYSHDWGWSLGGGSPSRSRWAVCYGAYGDKLYYEAKSRDELLLWLIDQIAKEIPTPTK
jgi:hypothetical protein